MADKFSLPLSLLTLTTQATWRLEQTTCDNDVLLQEMLLSRPQEFHSKISTWQESTTQDLTVIIILFQSFYLSRHASFKLLCGREYFHNIQQIVAP